MPQKEQMNGYVLSHAKSNLVDSKLVPRIQSMPRQYQVVKNVCSQNTLVARTAFSNATHRARLLQYIDCRMDSENNNAGGIDKRNRMRSKIKKGKTPPLPSITTLSLIWPEIMIGKAVRDYLPNGTQNSQTPTSKSILVMFATLLLAAVVTTESIDVVSNKVNFMGLCFACIDAVWGKGRKDD